MGRCTDKKENQIFLMYKEIQNGAVAKSYMTNGLLIYRETLGSPSSYMTLQRAPSEFPYILYEEIYMKNLLLNFKNPSMQ